MLVGALACHLHFGVSHKRPGPDRFDEAMTYVEKNRLYNLALSIWEETENYKVSSWQLRRFWVPINLRVNLVRPEHLWRVPVRKKRVFTGSYR